MTPKPPLPVRSTDRLPRLAGWLLTTVLLALLVWALAPQQLPLSLYKLSLVTLGGVVGYWLDRSLFPYARPDMFLPIGQCIELRSDNEQLHDEPPVLLEPELDPALLLLAGHCMLRRAAIVAAAMLAMGLGA